MMFSRSACNDYNPMIYASEAQLSLQFIFSWDVNLFKLMRLDNREQQERKKLKN